MRRTAEILSLASLGMFSWFLNYLHPSRSFGIVPTRRQIQVISSRGMRMRARRSDDLEGTNAHLQGFHMPETNMGERSTTNNFEDAALQLAMAGNLAEEFGPKLVQQIEAFNATITLVGANHVSRFAAQLASGVVGAVRPSALLLELCPERVDFLVRGNEHRWTRPKKLLFEDSPDVLRRAYSEHGNEARTALRAFMGGMHSGSKRDAPSKGMRERSSQATTSATNQQTSKLLVLGDMRASETDEADLDMECQLVLRLRDRRLAETLAHTARLGHQQIVAVLGALHLEGVRKELLKLELGADESMMNELDSQLDALRGCPQVLSYAVAFAAAVYFTFKLVIHRAFSKEILPGSGEQVAVNGGVFISEKGIHKLLDVKQKLLKKVPPGSRLQKMLKRAAEGARLTKADKQLQATIVRLTSSERIFNMLKKDSLALEPSDYPSLQKWWTSQGV
eukprot:TRINITY_DN36247_c0_g1_i1.p1 TRINITY_DN36247_c0_g1~~TRINITY_DN36247_c0_g1_i1.p1  ORF type:complete len:451 (-),score=70.59 TRINITY_DN36247_c0_g1_i1:63-1415(-)